MNCKNLIASTAEKRIRFRNADGSLRFYAPSGAVDDLVKTNIREHREAISGIVNSFAPSWCLIAPAAINQASLFFLQKLYFKSTAYHVAISFQLCSVMNKQAFEAACKLMLVRHTQLQVSFGYYKGIAIDESFTYQIIPERETACIRYDNQKFTSNNDLRTSLTDDYSGPFDMESGPLVRWTVFDASSDSPVVLMTMHHAVTDAWSIRIIFSELLTEYNRYLQCAPGFSQSNNSMDHSYIDFTLHQQKAMSNVNVMKQIAAYGAMVQSCCTPLNLPIDFIRPAVVELKGKSLPFVLSTEIYGKLSGVARTYGVSVKSMLFTSYAVLLWRETGQTHFTVGVPFANRMDSSFSDTVGYFANTVAIPVCINPDVPLLELARKADTVFTKASSFQDLPFSTLVEYLNPPRDSSRSPVFQVLFNVISHSVIGAAGDFIYDGIQETAPRLVEGVNIQPFPVPQQDGQYDLTFEIVERKTYASGQLKYSDTLFSQSSAERLLQRYMLILSELINNASDKILPSIKETFPARKKQMVITATFTAEPVAESLAFWIDRLGLDLEPVFAPYGQVLQQLLDTRSLLRSGSGGSAVILLRLDDLSYSETDGKPLRERLSARCDEILAAVTAAATSHDRLFLVFFCPCSPDLISDPLVKAVVDHMEEKFTILFNALPGVYATSSNTVLSWYPVAQYHDQLRLEHGHIPYTSEFFTAIATAIVRRFFVIKEKPVKVISLDCDNTLWSGVAGENGPQGVMITDYHQDFQKLLVAQKETGKLLTLISKNNEEDVNDVFSKNGSMLLHASLIYSKRINWVSKSENLRSLAEEIKTGLDGFVFIDDNPVECAEIEVALPEVVTLQFPAVHEEIPSFMSGLWVLDNPKITSEDSQRNQFYHIERHRHTLRTQSVSIADFMEKLELSVTFDPFNHQNGERLSQLTFRTNQFNMTNKRFTYHELCLLRENNYDIFSISVKDRFGNYGIVGMTACKYEAGKVMVDIFLLSCRVLGRGIEYRMLNELIRIALQRNIDVLHLSFSDTGRNHPALIFIEDICKQYPPAKKENGLILNALVDVPRFCAVNEQLVSSTCQLPQRENPTVMDSGSRDILKRNRHYKDIIKNLSSINSICHAVEQHVKRKKGIFDLPGATLPAVHPYEAEIACLWKKMLRVSSIDMQAQFFELGGTSLLLPQLLAELECAFGVKLQLIDMFKYTSVRTLAAHVHACSSNRNVESPGAVYSAENRQHGIQSMREHFQRVRNRMNS